MEFAIDKLIEVRERFEIGETSLLLQQYNCRRDTDSLSEAWMLAAVYFGIHT